MRGGWKSSVALEAHFTEDGSSTRSGDKRLFLRTVPENALLESVFQLEKEDLSNKQISLEEGLFIEKTECSNTCVETTIDRPSCLSCEECPGDGHKLRLRHRQSVCIPRPHSWHSSKLLENQPNPSMMQISQGTIGSPWHQAYHSSSSASDLSNYEHGYLRRSPDHYSSRGSMESLEHTSSSYHPCHLSPAKSTNSIDQLSHLHTKRDSAYSSFSTNSSIPEYHPIMFCKERSYSMESMLSRGNLQDGIKHADIRYIKTVYDSQRGVSEEYEVNSSLVKQRARSSSGYSKNSGGPMGRLDHNRYLSESDITEKGPPMPPTRSDSYSVTKHHERPSSWSSLDQQKSFRAHSKGSATPMACSTVQQQKPMYGEGQLHTVMEKSPECSPLMKPKQTYSQIPQPGQPMLPTGKYLVPSPEPHFAHAPQPLKNNNGRLYPALAKEGASSGGKGVSFSQTSQNVHNSSTLSAGKPNRTDKKVADGPTDFAHYKLHFSVSPEHQTGSPQSNENKMSPSRLNQPAIKDDHQLKTDCRKNAQELSNTEKKRHSGPVFHYEWNHSQNKTEVFCAATSMESCRTNNSTDANKDKDCGFLYSTGSSFDSKLDERHSPLMTPYKSKLESGSFTKHIEDVDSSVMSYTSSSNEPSSPSQKNSVDYTRRRLHSGSNQSGSNPIPSTVVKQRTSVLEKICKIEQREHESQKSPASFGSTYGQHSAQSPRGTSNRASVNSIEDIRSKFHSQDHIPGVESRRSSSSQANDKVTGTQLLKTAGSLYSVKLGDAQKTTVESQADKMQETNNEQSVLQALPDSDKRTVDSQTTPNKEDHWQNASQDTLGFNRAYRNSIKDAQSKVLEATSYRRRDLEISPPQYKKPERSAKRPTSAIVYSKSSVSPHAPKERHSITPTDNFLKNQESQSQEGKGAPHQVARIGARRRLTTEQKKRSYSEPEKMNEVGASDTELSTTNIQKRGQHISFMEQSVADRRRLFERDGKACSTVNLSKPELKQLQQNALADYIERKTGRRPSSQEPGFLKERSQSTYFSGSLMDNQSVSSTSSMTSLQEHNIFCTRDSNLAKTGRVSSTLPPGLTGLFDLEGLEKKSDYPESRARTSSFVQQRFRFESRSKNELRDIPTVLPTEVTASKPTEFFELSRERKSDRATSAEDLAQNLSQPVPLHRRSRSSPADEKRSQDFGVKYEVSVTSKSYASTGTGLRPAKSKTEDASEKEPHEPVFSSYTAHPTSPGGERQSHPSTRTIQMGIQRHTRAQSLGPSSELHSHLHGGRLSTVTSSGNPNLSKMTIVSPSHNLKDAFSTEDNLCPLKNADISLGEHKDNFSMDLRSQSNNFVNSNNEKLKTKSSPPQRPPLLKVTCLDPGKEGNLPLTNHSSPGIEPSLSVGAQNNQMWSTSSSEPETPSNYGKVSLRISESCLQSSSPVVVHDEDDDEVFVKEQEVETFAEKTFVVPSPPPFPPPSLEDALLRESQEAIQHVPLKKNLNERYPFLVEGAQSIDKEDRTLDPSTFNLPVNNFEFSQNKIPQFTTSSVGSSHSSLHYPPTQDETPSSKALEISDHKVASFESTLSQASTHEMTPEDVKSQELAKEIVIKDRSLADILDPELKMKTTMDLMGGLFMKSTCTLREKNRRWLKERMVHSGEHETSDNKNIPAENGIRSSMFYSMSAPKAELLKRITDIHSEGARGVEYLEVNEKKAELIASLNHKLEILKHAKESLLVDIKLNNSLGEEVEVLVEKLCKPNEFDKYKMFIGDLDKVVNLLLSLSGRLAKVENVLNTLGQDANAEERNTWNEKKKQLCGQHEDARELKENLDRREKLVTDILGNYLTGEQFQDYQHFVKMKSALLIEQRELDDKIKLGQEQLNCLLESLPTDFIASRKVPSASSGNVKMLPPLITSL